MSFVQKYHRLCSALIKMCKNLQLRILFAMFVSKERVLIQMLFIKYLKSYCNLYSALNVIRKFIQLACLTATSSFLQIIVPLKFQRVHYFSGVLTMHEDLMKLGNAQFVNKTDILKFQKHHLALAMSFAITQLNLMYLLKEVAVRSAQARTTIVLAFCSDAAMQIATKWPILSVSQKSSSHFK